MARAGEVEHHRELGRGQFALTPSVWVPPRALSLLPESSDATRPVPGPLLITMVGTGPCAVAESLPSRFGAHAPRPHLLSGGCPHCVRAPRSDAVTRSPPHADRCRPGCRPQRAGGVIRQDLRPSDLRCHRCIPPRVCLCRSVHFDGVRVSHKHLHKKEQMNPCVFVDLLFCGASGFIWDSSALCSGPDLQWFVC